MGKVTNIFFGIGVAVIVYVVVLLGIQAFYHEVTWNDYNCTAPSFYDDLKGCSENMTVGQCLTYRSNNAIEASADQAAYNECNDRYQSDTKSYNKNFFLITSILGALAIILATLLVPLTNIAVGISFSGLALIIWGFIRGWESTGDSLKFMVAIVIAAIIIWLGVRMSGKKR